MGLQPGKPFKIGRHKSNDFVVSDLKAVSSYHTEVLLSEGGATSSREPVCYVRDMSQNGTGIRRDSDSDWSKVSKGEYHSTRKWNGATRATQDQVWAKGGGKGRGEQRGPSN